MPCRACSRESERAPLHSRSGQSSERAPASSSHGCSRLRPFVTFLRNRARNFHRCGFRQISAAEYEPPEKPRPDHSQYRARDQHVAQGPASGGLGLFDLVERLAHLAQRCLLDRALRVFLDRSTVDVVRCLDAHVAVPSSEMSCLKTDRSGTTSLRHAELSVFAPIVAWFAWPRAARAPGASGGWQCGQLALRKGIALRPLRLRQDLP